MLTMSTTLKKYLYFAICCHGYVDINAGNIDINRSGLPARMFFALKLALSVESTKG